MELTDRHVRAIGAAIREPVPALTSRPRYVAVDASEAVLVDEDAVGADWVQLRAGVKIADLTSPVLLVRFGSWAFVVKLVPDPPRARALPWRTGGR